MTTVAVLGSGIMGSALAVPLTDNGHEVRLVGTHLDREIIDSVKSSRIHPNLDLAAARRRSAATSSRRPRRPSTARRSCSAA